MVGVAHCCSVTKSCLTLCNPMNCSLPGFPALHYLPEFAQTHVHRVSGAIQPSRPLLSPSPPAFNRSQHQGLFQWVGSSHQVAKVLEFGNISPSNECSGLISLIFRAGGITQMPSDRSRASLDACCYGLLFTNLWLLAEPVPWSRGFPTWSSFAAASGEFDPFYPDGSNLPCTKDPATFPDRAWLPRDFWTVPLEEVIPWSRSPSQSSAETSNRRQRPNGRREERGYLLGNSPFHFWNRNVFIYNPTFKLIISWRLSSKT